jgi:hypothetical protein
MEANIEILGYICIRIKVAFLIFQNSIKRETGSKPVLFPQL